MNIESYVLNQVKDDPKLLKEFMEERTRQREAMLAPVAHQPLVQRFLPKWLRKGTSR